MLKERAREGERKRMKIYRQIKHAFFFFYFVIGILQAISSVPGQLKTIYFSKTYTRYPIKVLVRRVHDESQTYIYMYMYCLVFNHYKSYFYRTPNHYWNKIIRGISYRNTKKIRFAHSVVPHPQSSRKTRR